MRDTVTHIGWNEKNGDTKCDAAVHPKTQGHEGPALWWRKYEEFPKKKGTSPFDYDKAPELIEPIMDTSMTGLIYRKYIPEAMISDFLEEKMGRDLVAFVLLKTYVSHGRFKTKQMAWEYLPSGVRKNISKRGFFTSIARLTKAEFITKTGKKGERHYAILSRKEINNRYGINENHCCTIFVSEDEKPYPTILYSLMHKLKEYGGEAQTYRVEKAKVIDNLQGDRIRSAAQYRLAMKLKKSSPSKTLPPNFDTPGPVFTNGYVAKLINSSVTTAHRLTEFAYQKGMTKKPRVITQKVLDCSFEDYVAFHRRHLTLRFGNVWWKLGSVYRNCGTTFNLTEYWRINTGRQVFFKRNFKTLEFGGIKTAA